MKLLIQLIFLLSFGVSTIPHAYATDKNTRNNLMVISVYQIEDDLKAGFDFFTSQKAHKCGGKLSNRFRSYSDHTDVSERKFQLILTALNFKHSVSVKLLGCEGRSMLVDYIGISLHQ